MTTPEQQEPPDDSSMEGRLIDLITRVISLLKWIIIPLVLTAIVLVFYLIFSPLVVAMAFSDPKYDAAEIKPLIESSEATVQAQLKQVLGVITPLGESFWHFLSPLIGFAIATALLRWIFFGRRSDGLRSYLTKIISDVPSLIAISVMATVCILPLTERDIPQPISNIALVVVGYYFAKRADKQ